MRITTKNGDQLDIDHKGYEKLAKSWYNTTKDMVATAMWISIKTDLCDKSALQLVEKLLNQRAVLQL